MPETTVVPPQFEQVAEYYRVRVRDGRLRPGDLLPANRTMAQSWNIATGTAAAAVARLREEGWVTVRPGRAPIVRGVPEGRTL